MGKFDEDILSMLAKMRPHPQFYLGEKSISRLRCFLDGFSVGYSYPHLKPLLPGFQEYIEAKYPLDLSSLSWNHILLLVTHNDEAAALDLFYSELDSFLSGNNEHSTEPYGKAPDNDYRG